MTAAHEEIQRERANACRNRLLRLVEQHKPITPRSLLAELIVLADIVAAILKDDRP